MAFSKPFNCLHLLIVFSIAVMVSCQGNYRSYYNGNVRQNLDNIRNQYTNKFNIGIPNFSDFMNNFGNDEDPCIRKGYCGDAKPFSDEK